MKLILYTHPDFVGSRSQSHFARMLQQAYRARGHEAELRQPQARWRHVFTKGPTAKWAGYVDQYLLFPRHLRRQLQQDPPDALHVFCDQAVGPWIPPVAGRPHVVHCHDLLALRSALGLIPENPTGWTGRIYQRYIRAGFQQARHFISISEKTRADLHEFGGVRPQTSVVVLNSLNHPYAPMDVDSARELLVDQGLTCPAHGFVLHVGGGQWYKNTVGVLALYAQLVHQRHAAGLPLPALLVVGPTPPASQQALLHDLPAGASARFVTGLPPATLQALYNTALALLFPSLAEGFGWPIAEGLACGCPVLTTDEAPMTEVGGTAAHYLPRRQPQQPLQAWAAEAARVLNALLQLPPDEQAARREAGLRWAARFAPDNAINAYLQVYDRLLRNFGEPPAE